MEAISSFIPHSIVFIAIASSLLIFSLGLSFWLGEILGKTFYGFFVIAGFYFITGIMVHLFMHNQLKKLVGNYFVKQALK